MSDLYLALKVKVIETAPPSLNFFFLQVSMELPGSAPQLTWGTTVIMSSRSVMPMITDHACTRVTLTAAMQPMVSPNQV